MANLYASEEAVRKVKALAQHDRRLQHVALDIALDEAIAKRGIDVDATLADDDAPKRPAVETK